MVERKNKSYELQYITATPDCLRCSRLRHNMLKECHEQDKNLSAALTWSPGESSQALAFRLWSPVEVSSSGRLSSAKPDIDGLSEATLHCQLKRLKNAG